MGTVTSSFNSRYATPVALLLLRHSMKLLLTAFFNGLISFAMAQSEEMRWIKNYGAERDEKLTSIAPTPDGGFIVAGYTTSKNFMALSHHGGMEGLLIKCDSTGQVEWRKLLGGPGDDGLLSVSPTRDKGYILCGWQGGAGGDVTDRCWGKVDGWVVKLDSMAHVQWNRSFGKMYMDMVYSVTETMNGDFLVGHVHEDWIIDSYLYRLSPTGKTKWSKKFNKDYALNIKAVELTDKSILMCVVERGYKIMRIDSSGKEVWEKRLGPTTCTYVYGFDVDARGNFALCVRLRKYDTLLKKYLPCNFFVVKGDKNGKILFEREFGTVREEEPSSILIRRDGGLAMTGYVEGETDSIIHGKRDIFLVLCDSSGENESYHCIGGSSDESALGVAETANGNLLVCGQSISWDHDMPGTFGLYDGIVFEFGKRSTIVVPVNEDSSEVDTVGTKMTEALRLIYPVPATDVLTIEGLEQGEFVTVYNSMGEVMFASEASGGILKIGVLEWPGGPYIISRRFGTRNEIDKIVKQH